MTNTEKLAEAREELEDIVKRIEAFDGGDRPSSPPASLLMEEARLRGLVDWYEQAERERIEREKKFAKPAPASVPPTTTPPTGLPS